MGYRIKTVAERTGIPRNTILAWERRYDLFNVARASNGFREYTEKDVELLARIKALCDEGYRVSEAISLLRERDEALGSVPAPAKAPMSGVVGGQHDLMDRLLAFDRAGADRVMETLWFLPFERIVDDVFLPCLKEMGDGWAQGRYSITQEHFMSAFLRDQLGAMLRQLGGGPEQGHTALCAAIEGDSHELGLLTVAIKLALRGWRIENLGADLPVVELARHARTSDDAQLVIVAVTLKRPEAELRRVLNALRALIPREITVVAGGPGVTVLRVPNEDRALDGVYVCERFEDMTSVLAGLDTTLGQRRNPRLISGS
ncbi:MerR family transcriptional regulator [Myxococcota bacterium]|nr:MerR family transcriptional regulator [Myxococcota bacterium]